MKNSFQKIIWIIAILSILPGISRTAAARQSLEDMEAQLADIKRCEAEQRQNILRMRQELKDAAEQKRIPDTSKLKHYATATGQRTEAYRQAPKHIQVLIDKFEHRPISNGIDAFRLAISTMIGGKLGHAVKTYLLEIERSEYFLNKLLIPEEQKLVKKIVQLKAAPAFQLELQHARFDDVAAKLEKEIENIEAIRKQIRDAYSKAEGFYGSAAKNFEAANVIRQSIGTGMSEVSELVTACQESSKIGDDIAIRAAELIDAIENAGKSFGNGKDLVGKCESAASVQEGLKNVEKGKRLAKFASENWHSIQESEGVLEKLKEMKSQAEKMKAALEEKKKKISELAEAVWGDVHEFFPAVWQVTSLCNNILPERKNALLKQIEKIRDAFAADDVRVNNRLDGLRKLLLSAEPANEFVMKVDSLIKTAKGYERKLDDMEKDVAEYLKEFDKRVKPCSEINMPEGAINEAAESLTMFGTEHSDMGKETEAEAKKCLELLGQKGQPAGTAVQGVQEKTSGYMAAETKLSGTGRWEDGPYGGPITLSIILDPASGGGTWTAQFSGGGRAASVAGSASGQLKGSADSAALSGKVNYRVSIKGGQTVSLSGGISGSLAGSQIKGRWSSGGDSGTFTATVK